MQLGLNFEETLVITGMDATLEPAFAEGIVMPAARETIPALPGYATLNTLDPRMGDQKALAKNAFRSPFGAFVSALKSAFQYTNVTAFENGYLAGGDVNYSDGQLRYYKNIFGEVRVQGLVSTPISPGANQVITYLPDGYRPAVGDNQIVACVNDDAFVSIQVASDGSITARGTPASGWISINLCFKAG